MLKPGAFLRHIPGEATSIYPDLKEKGEEDWEMARYKLREFGNKVGGIFQKLGLCFHSLQEGSFWGMDAIGALTRAYRRVRYSKF